MTEKTIPVPSFSSSYFELHLSNLKTGGNIRRFRLAHMKEEDGALVCAEGLTLRYTPTFVFDKMSVIPGDIMLGNGDGRRQYLVVSERAVNGPKNMQFAMYYYDTENVRGTFIICAEHVAYIHGGAYNYYNYIGGTCAALYNDRFFFGKGQRLYYGIPMIYKSWDYGARGCGYLDFVGDGGNIVGLEPFRDKIYIFREREICVLEVGADPLEFKLKKIPFVYGNILAKSVANSSEAIYFLTDQGLCAIDNAGKCIRIENADEREIDFSEPVSGVYFKHGYYASVCLKSGERVAYCYDVRHGMGRYIFQVCELIGANETLYFASQQNIYELCGKALPDWGECALTLEFTLGRDPEKTALDWIVVTGVGELNYMLESAEGGRVTGKGVCGKRMRLPRILRGDTFRLKLVPKDEGFQFGSVKFGIGRAA